MRPAGRANPLPPPSARLRDSEPELPLPPTPHPPPSFNCHGIWSRTGDRFYNMVRLRGSPMIKFICGKPPQTSANPFHQPPSSSTAFPATLRNPICHAHAFLT
ncbi:uncharacterized protein LAESUDRAFT_320119 [Laetiporus sulphureus 93-53]|uniref:Uncharacterized protein n=1 Tax=Laetiporus sulphureus 93-53 TaxID=1314785 RepID=A0A165D1E5_9APHY|nr:uncharacterized protein LAESUDRAFT_320119 [Laetiporus sulphureus 93-53]KZT03952.1 hypothetical protein LAESUDRAFT_320119 [Laetiporus sulphureus 93-53]